MKLTATAVLGRSVGTGLTGVTSDVTVPSLRSLANADVSEIASILAEELQPTLDYAIQVVPVKSGALRATLRIESDVEGAVASAYVIAGGGAVDYAKWVEAGPHARPYLRPAFESTIESVVDKATVRIGAYLGRLAK